MDENDALFELHRRWAGVARRREAEGRAPTRSVLFLYEALGRPTLSASQTRRRNWLASIRSLEAWVDREGRLPAHNARARIRDSDSSQRRLADWVRYQRRTRYSLASYQTQRLETVPGFHWEPIDEVWDVKLQALVALGRPARTRSSDNGERALARWSLEQRRRYRNGELAKHRADALAALTFWTW